MLHLHIKDIICRLKWLRYWQNHLITLQSNGSQPPCWLPFLSGSGVFSSPFHTVHHIWSTFKHHNITELKLEQMCPLLISKSSHINRSSCCVVVYFAATLNAGPVLKKRWQNSLMWCLIVYFLRAGAVCFWAHTKEKQLNVSMHNTVLFCWFCWRLRQDYPVIREFTAVSSSSWFDWTHVRCRSLGTRVIILCFICCDCRILNSFVNLWGYLVNGGTDKPLFPVDWSHQCLPSVFWKSLFYVWEINQVQ